MNAEQRPGAPALSPKATQAVRELQGLIRQHYPEASFALSRAEDDPDAIHLDAVVERDDPDGVIDVVIDRMLELQLEEGIPIYVIPLRSAAQEAILRQRLEREALPPGLV